MFTLLLTLLILDGILMMVIILLQAGKGGGLAAMGGGGGGTAMDSVMGGRHASTMLTKLTWGTGAVFLLLSLVLAVMSSQSRTPAPLLQEEFRQGAPIAPQPILPGGDIEGAEPLGPAGAVAPEGGEPDGGSRP